MSTSVAKRSVVEFLQFHCKVCAPGLLGSIIWTVLQNKVHTRFIIGVHTLSVV